MTREAVNVWAMQWVAARDAGIDDSSIWEAMMHLAGIDLRHGEGLPFLHDKEQIAEWRAELAAT